MEEAKITIINEKITEGVSEESSVHLSVEYCGTKRLINIDTYERGGLARINVWTPSGWRCLATTAEISGFEPLEPTIAEDGDPYEDYDYETGEEGEEPEEEPEIEEVTYADCRKHAIDSSIEFLKKIAPHI